MPASSTALKTPDCAVHPGFPQNPPSKVMNAWVASPVLRIEKYPRIGPAQQTTTTFF